MRRQGSVRGPVRRTVLTAAVGLLTAGVAGCGLRLDRDPQMPVLSPIDVLRDAVARTLTATEVGEAVDDGTAAAIRAFAEAVGPPWNPPADLAEPVSPPNPDPSPQSPAEGLLAVAGLVVEAAPRLGRQTGPTVAVLADVAVGALLHLDALEPDSATAIRADLTDALREVLDGDATNGGQPDSGDPASGAPDDDVPEDEAPDDGDPEDGGPDDVHPLTALITACYTGVYAYERAAVHLPADDAARQSAHTRIGRLHSITAIAATLAEGIDVPSDRPAWDLPVVPRDPGTAREALRSAEDGVVAALSAARADVPPAAFLSWLDDSGRARRTAGGAQDLRFAADAHEEDG